MTTRRSKNEVDNRANTGSGLLPSPVPTEAPVPEPPNTYWAKFAEIIDNGDWGNWYTVGIWKGNKTARVLKHDILTGTVKIPGELARWELEFERPVEGGSVLKVCYRAEG